MNTTQDIEKRVFEKAKKAKRKPRILITYIESGMGHITSAKAIRDGLLEKYADKIELIESDIMKDDQSERLIKFEQFLVRQVKTTAVVRGYGPLMFGLLNVLGKQKFLQLAHHSILKKVTDETVEALRKRNPDVVISTHYFITLCAIELKRRFMPDLIVVTYNPDNNVHVWWDNRSDLFITNNDMASNEAVNIRKFRFNAIKQVYFTARKEILEANGTKAGYREAFGLPKNKFTVIVADGAYAMAKAKKFTDELLKTKKELTILMIAGKNQKVFDYFTKKAENLPENITFRVYPFMPNIHELYAASDLFITKAGPNAILDAIYMGTPVLVNFYAQCMEKAAYRLFIKQMGCGIREKNAKRARKIIESFIDNPELVKQYQENTKKIDKKMNGSNQVADIVMEEISKQTKKVF